MEKSGVLGVSGKPSLDGVPCRAVSVELRVEQGVLVDPLLQLKVDE